MKEIVHVDINEHDFYIGKRWQARNCPIKYAFKRKFKCPIAIGRFDCWVDYGNNKEIHYKLLPEATEWIKNYDEEGIRKEGRLNLFADA